MEEIGEYAAQFFQAFCNKGTVYKYDYRTISGILALRGKHKDSVINMACRRALYYNCVTFLVLFY